MRNKVNKKNYIKQLLVAIDQLINAVFFGWADETLSSRCYRKSELERTPKKRWKLAYRIVNIIFFDGAHCRKAYCSEKTRNHSPADLRLHSFKQRG